MSRSGFREIGIRESAGSRRKGIALRTMHYWHRVAEKGVLFACTVLLCLLPGAMAGCGGGSGGVRNPFQADEQVVRIDVLNRNFADATLRAIVGGASRRLGRVTGHSSGSFTLDWPYSRPLAIEIDLLAGVSCTTREINVDPGDVIELQIEPNFATSEGCRLRRD